MKDTLQSGPNEPHSRILFSLDIPRMPSRSSSHVVFMCTLAQDKKTDRRGISRGTMGVGIKAERSERSNVERVHNYLPCGANASGSGPRRRGFQEGEAPFGRGSNVRENVGEVQKHDKPMGRPPVMVMSVESSPGGRALSCRECRLPRLTAALAHTCDVRSSNR